mmetsp:Transcript_34163/g.41314  ORF Transcript_34163/g.41314 Transcript_34163/m.41314 type:complete len:287 (+) Transcript_34163:185-1045(+)|eukprot:CAMPEP_0197848152 /NCGR_PEP_ID=MMETSP1438-20131217/7952_1 /TAXON_ID=1461541 /ORGANISM="Pterosperma sp., Strain CCMP1384" /LENGTH=286 /DNA_ID=CAMNT_0043460291 /DNA_START=179 /DNA_END=1039 /DNA_ORIENTATION=-
MANDQVVSVLAEESPSKDKQVHVSAQQAHSDDDLSEDESLALLPRHTKVRVTGNNRTKTALVGMEGIVKKAVGLGGWHWLSLSNGLEVRLQRNALSVLEDPPIDGDDMDDNQMLSPNHDNKDGVGGETDHHRDEAEYNRQSRPKRPKTAGPTNGRMTPGASSMHSPTDPSPGSSSGSIRKPATLRRLNHRKPPGTNKVPPFSSGHPSSGGSRMSPQTPTSFVNFHKLDTGSLKKYRHFYKLEAGPNPTKDQLVSAVSNHFVDYQVDESNTISSFILALQSSSRTPK